MPRWDDLCWIASRRWRAFAEWSREHRRVSIGGIAALVVVATLIGVVAMPSGRPRMVDRVPMIDVQSAEVFWMSTRARAVSVPAEHPKTGARTLVGVDLEPDGSWRVLPQDLALVPTLGVRVSKRIDAATGAVTPEKERGR